MSRSKGFWIMWSTYCIGIICFFYIIGLLDNVDIGKSVILTLFIILPAYPIKLWIKSNNDLFDD